MRFSILLAIECALAVPVTAHGAAKGAGAKAAAKAPKLAPAADPARVEAKALTQAANQDYTLGRFTSALDKYSRAYDKIPAPELLFNIGQCHKNLHDNERAVFFFQGYLRAKPDAPNQKLVEDMIAELNAERERKERKERAERERNERVRPRAAVAPSVAPVPGLAADNPIYNGPPPAYKRAWFWGVIGGGVAAAAVATTLAIVLTSGAPPRATSQGNVDLR